MDTPTGWERAIAALRAELQGKVPLGNMFAESRAQIAALAEEVRALNQKVADLQRALGDR